jgi:hypothetical protein
MHVLLTKIIRGNALYMCVHIKEMQLYLDHTCLPAIRSHTHCYNDHLCDYTLLRPYNVQNIQIYIPSRSIH